MNPLESDDIPHFWSSGGIALSLTLLLAFLALGKPTIGDPAFRKIEELLSRFAQHKKFAVCSVFLAIVAVRLAALPLLPVPIPGVHDEFSYLLLADTLAHGRMTNPPHPMWMSFETFHVNWFPTYSSMFPPAQGFVLMMGQMLGHPWIGVLLSNAAMCAAILWMLQAWMPGRWALLGASLAALNLGIASYWMNSYWGGAVAGVGGALVLGALPRIKRHSRPRDALLLALGIAILANSRPLEGLIFSVPAAGWFLLWLAGKKKPKHSTRARLQRVFLPLVVVIVLAGAFLAYYNWRVTGNALLMPHVLNTRTYHTTPLFLWGHAKPQLHYNNPQFEDFYNGWAREDYQTTWRDALRVSWEKVKRCSLVFLWPGCVFLLPGLAFALSDRKMGLLLATLLVSAAGVFAVIWSEPHYAAPLTCVIYAVLAQSVRHLRTVVWKRNPVGVALSRVVVVALVLGTSIRVARHLCDPLEWPCMGNPSRVFVTQQLTEMPGKHLIVVRYAKDHNIHDEWVYNGADIDGAKILWARELGPEQNAKLFAYFRDRQIWLIEPDIDNTEIRPYSPPLSGDSRSQGR